MESFNGHFKGENGSLFFDARNMWELKRAIALQIKYYNAQRRHSALGYLSSVEFEQEIKLAQGHISISASTCPA